MSKMPSSRPISQCATRWCSAKDGNGAPSSMPTHHRRTSTLSLSSSPSGTLSSGRLGISNKSSRRRLATRSVASLASRSSSPRVRLSIVSASAVSRSFSRLAAPTRRDSSFTSARRRSASCRRRRCSTSSAHDLVNLARRDAAAAKGRLDNVGLTAQLGEINHA